MRGAYSRVPWSPTVASIVLVVVCVACRTPDPAMVDIEVYFTDTKMVNDSGAQYEDMVRPVIRRVRVTDDIAAAAIREMLTGPTREEQERGLVTSMPDRATIKAKTEAAVRFARSFPNAEVARQSRYMRGVVTLLRLRIDDGTAYADFSNEIHAYGGGGMPSALISTQIVKTLRQFPEIGAVVISVEGRTANVLQP